LQYTDNDSAALNMARLILLQKGNQLSHEEEKMLESWLSADPANQQLFDEWSSEEYLVTTIQELRAVNTDKAIQKVLQTVESPIQTNSKIYHRVHFLRTAWFRYAATVLIIFGIGAYIFLSKKPVEKPSIVAQQNKQPGSDKATLTLSDGRIIILDNANKESIADGSISIEKNDGVLTYNSAHISEGKNITYNIMNTPRGGQYQLVLPDGSKVWLNSASSIKYPTIFNGSSRRIELSGEAYFDIKQNKKFPFIIKTQKAEVFVLGTAFNINSYLDEPEFSTTLINGSVKVSAGNNAKILSPGQQAKLNHSNILEINKNVNISQVIAWQKGMFVFENTDILTIARQLSRWYDVEIKTEGDVSRIKLGGGISKHVPLSKTLELLKANGANYKWLNNKLIFYVK
jgi:transmembrane sensor